MLCGVISFFFLAFLFAYFYLRALNINHQWRPGAVNPSLGLGTSIMAVLLLSAVIFRLGTKRVADTLSSGIVALVLGLISIVLQVIEYTTLGFGAASGGYASVFLGWTGFYMVFTLFGLYWIEIQMASLVGRDARAGSIARAGGSAGRGRGPAPRRHRGVLVLLGVLRRHRGDRLHRPLRGLRDRRDEPVARIGRSIRHSPMWRWRRCCIGWGPGGCGPMPQDALRAASFAAGLLTLVIALDSPIDTYADQLFWVHMLQHILLLTVAPPLILLGRPWPRMWRALPLSTRTAAGRTIAARVSGPSSAEVDRRPGVAWVLFNAAIVAWHIPVAYNATLTSPPIHNLEHAMFFFPGCCSGLA